MNLFVALISQYSVISQYTDIEASQFRYICMPQFSCVNISLLNLSIIQNMNLCVALMSQYTVICASSFLIIVFLITHFNFSITRHLNL